MKKIFAILISMSLACGAYAQSFGSRMADVDLELELGESPISLAPLSYIYFGFNGLTSTDTELSQSTGFFRSQQLGVNMLEFAVRPFEGGRFSLGADFSVNWYHLNPGLFWYPYDYVGNLGVPIPKENGPCVSIATEGMYGVLEVKRSNLSVITFGFPLTFSYSFGPFTMALGAALELNLNGRTQFKGINMDGSNIADTKSGKFFSNRIYSNLVTFDVHAGFSFGGLGLYAKFCPLPKFYKGVHGDEKREIVCGPQFQTWSVGLILGLGI